MFRGIAGDLRLAARSLRAAPAVTIAAILTLVLGIGATTAIFSVANGLALRLLPVKEPQSLVTITSDTALRHGYKAGAGWSYGMWDQLRQRAGAFDGALAWSLQRLDLSEGGEMQPVNVLIASGGFFDVLGVPPVIGRTFNAADDVPGGGPDGAVAVISYSLWQRRFGGRQDVRGSRLLIEQVPVTVVGVAPRWFRGVDIGQPFDVALPFGTEPLVRGRRSFVNNENALVLLVMLRLKPEQSISSATAALHAMQPQILGTEAPAFLNEPFILVDASTGIADRLRPQYVYPLVILSIVSGLVLVIVCFNIANLLLSRASARRPEDSIRLALGAPRWRLGRQYFVEAVMVAAVGAVGGVFFAAWANRPIVSQLPVAGGPVSIDLSMDWCTLRIHHGPDRGRCGAFGDSARAACGPRRADRGNARCRSRRQWRTDGLFVRRTPGRAGCSLDCAAGGRRHVREDAESTRQRAPRLRPERDACCVSEHRAVNAHTRRRHAA